MNIEFADQQLALIETERAAETALPVAVIQCARQRLTIIRAAPDVPTMRNWRSLGFRERSIGSLDHLVALVPHWAMVLRLEEKNSAMTVVVISMEVGSRGTS